MQNHGLIYGCMGLGGGWNTNPISNHDIAQANSVIDVCLTQNIVVFDHADIYTFGKAEQVFGRVLKQRPELRDQIKIQTKCGIRLADDEGPKRYDFSPAWVRRQVNQSLTALNIEQLDTLFLHRPDPLADLPALASELSALHGQGKFKQLGVSNMHPSQITLLQSHCALPIAFNQLECSLVQPAMIQEEIFFNVEHAAPATGTLSYCRRKNIAVQAWGSLGYGLLTGKHSDDVLLQNTATRVSQLAALYQCSEEAIVIAWLCRHPADICPVIGSTQPTRIERCVQARTLQLSREHWYALLETRLGNEIP